MKTQTAPAEEEQPQEQKQVEIFGQVDQDKLNEWKLKYKQGIYSLVLPNEQGTNSAIYFKRPDRNDLNFSKSKRDPMAYDEQFKSLAEVTAIGGDLTLLKDEQAMISICFYMESMDVGKPMMVLNH